MSTTPNLGLLKPPPTDNFSVEHQNGNMDILDAVIKALQDGTTPAEILDALLDVDGTESNLDADKLDGKHGSYYLAVSAYTETDVLAKILSGGDLRVKLVSGIPQYSTDGVVWNPVGTPIVNASANVKHIWATDRAAASQQVVKVMQLMPTFSGQVRITAEIAASAGTGLLRFTVANATSSAAALPAKVAHEDVALGTVVQNASSLLVDQITILSSAGALYTLVTSTLEIQAGVPIVGVIHNITAGATTNIRNITMAYDIISNSVQQTV